MLPNFIFTSLQNMHEETRNQVKMKQKLKKIQWDENR